MVNRAPSHVHPKKSVKTVFTSVNSFENLFPFQRLVMLWKWHTFYFIRGKIQIDPCLVLVSLWHFHPLTFSSIYQWRVYQSVLTKSSWYSQPIFDPKLVNFVKYLYHLWTFYLDRFTVHFVTIDGVSSKIGTYAS